MPKSTMRLDLLIVERGLLPSRQAAQAAIMDGGVLVDGQKITKPGTAISADANVQLTNSWQGKKYASRGGFKLERALCEFDIDVAGRICLDVGASTGGFTDCLLKHGAAKVYAVDVGYGQIDWKLRSDDRVKVIERTNIRYLQPAQLYKAAEQKASICTIDVSFISLSKVLPSAIELTVPASHIVTLVKPQFEAGRQAVGKGGVVRDGALHVAVLQKFIGACLELDLAVEAITYSPVKGPAGNIEFLAHLLKADQKGSHPGQHLDIESVVATAHLALLSAQ